MQSIKKDFVSHEPRRNVTFLQMHRGTWGLGPVKPLALCWCSRHSVSAVFKQPGFQFIRKGFPDY